ncbi:MAG: hypothetical protein HY908_34210 [Myxococcales bacterium]|nr:hypothetical protein [Myxococcales bacterium]
MPRSDGPASAGPRPSRSQRSVASLEGDAGAGPSSTRTGRPAARTTESDPRPELRLVVSRSGLGVELGAPFELGPLRVVELVASLPGIGFPVDLSGGVTAFRHRRGRLERVAVTLDAEALRRFATRRLAGVFAEAAPCAVLAPIEDGLLVGVAGDHFALAFELLLWPADGDLVLLPMAARSLGLPGAPQAHALRAVAACTKGLGVVRGGVVTVPGVARQLVRALLPLAGMRAADAAGVRAGRVELDVGALGWRALRDAEGGAAGAALGLLGERLVRARELAELAAEAEDAHARGEPDVARGAYLAALERAPRHPELTRRIAELDRAAGGRDPAAASLLSDATPLVHAGVLGGALLAALGDTDAAHAAFAQAGQLEPYGPLAALAWLEASRVAPDREASLAALDEAVVRAPGLPAPRAARFEARLAAGNLRGAREDASQLEAAASGAALRHAVCMRAARAYVAAGAWAEASAAFERALRYLPDDAPAVAGLARALEAAGERRRALELLSRAVSLGERAGRRDEAILLDLARALADVAGDFPAAVARVRAIGPFGPASFEARALEARWRGELGDLAGASVALGRLADAVERAMAVLAGDAEPGPLAALFGPAGRYPRREDACAAVASLLADGAALEERERGDTLAARRLWGLALRLRPRDRQAQRELARLAAPAGRPAEAERVPARAPLASAPAPAQEPASEDSAHDEARAAELGDRLRANPADAEVGRALAAVLGRLGRHHELFALAAARVEEGGAEERATWRPVWRDALQALAADAEAAGREREAALFREMLAAAEAER